MCDMAAMQSIMLSNYIILKSDWVSTSAILTLLTKNVRIDNNENNAKMPIMLRSISAASNVTLQNIVQFYFKYVYKYV